MNTTEQDLNLARFYVETRTKRYEGVQSFSSYWFSQFSWTIPKQKWCYSENIKETKCFKRATKFSMPNSESAVALAKKMFNTNKLLYVQTSKNSSQPVSSVRQLQPTAHGRQFHSCKVCPTLTWESPSPQPRSTQISTVTNVPFIQRANRKASNVSISTATPSFPGGFFQILQCPSIATFLILPHFDVICDLLLNRRTAT